MNATSTASSASEAVRKPRGFGRGYTVPGLAAALYANSHSLEAMMKVLRAHSEKAAEEKATGPNGRTSLPTSLPN